MRMDIDAALAISASSLEKRLWARVNQSSTCWLWTGYRDAGGYGLISLGGRRGSKYRVHRVVYTLMAGQIPEGLDLDHLCSVRNCCNPAHLEPVTRAENMRRWKRARTHCKRGHEYTPENSHVDGKGARECRLCRRIRNRERYWRNKVAS